MKAGGRAANNTSPEPVSNWLASFTEDAMVLGGLWLAIEHPLTFLILLLLFLLVMVLILPKLVRFITAIFRRIAKVFKTNTASGTR